MRKLMQDSKGNIVEVNVGFDIKTCLMCFLGLGFVPSLFRRRIFDSFKIFIAEFLWIPFAIAQSFNSNIPILSSINYEIVLVLGFNYLIYRCIVNNKKREKYLKNKGFRAIKYNTL